jgi:hypothetical protein
MTPKGQGVPMTSFAKRVTKRQVVWWLILASIACKAAEVTIDRQPIYMFFDIGYRAHSLAARILDAVNSALGIVFLFFIAALIVQWLMSDD